MLYEVITRDAGCLIWLPHNVQVGAGTMNPATILRVLGPEPWNVAYIEPSIRPDDGRFGDNPNRMQMHYQLQVILKPDPGNPQELYLKSLEAIGIDLNQHDIRFVEDNWMQPALGAWGLGRITSYNVCYTKLLRHLQTSAIGNASPNIFCNPRLLSLNDSRQIQAMYRGWAVSIPALKWP